MAFERVPEERRQGLARRVRGCPFRLPAEGLEDEAPERRLPHLREDPRMGVELERRRLAVVGHDHADRVRVLERGQQSGHHRLEPLLDLLRVQRVQVRSAPGERGPGSAHRLVVADVERPDPFPGLGLVATQLRELLQRDLGLAGEPEIHARLAGAPAAVLHAEHVHGNALGAGRDDHVLRHDPILLAALHDVAGREEHRPVGEVDDPQPRHGAVRIQLGHLDQALLEGDGQGHELAVRSDLLAGSAVHGADRQALVVDGYSDLEVTDRHHGRVGFRLGPVVAAAGERSQDQRRDEQGVGHATHVDLRLRGEKGESPPLHWTRKRRACSLF
jgi:hypothetical protein